MRLSGFLIINFFLLTCCTSLEEKADLVPKDKFQILFRPTFHESAEINFLDSNEKIIVKMLFRPRNHQDGNTDTSYYLNQELSKSAYNEFRIAIDMKMRKAKSS